jgi:TolB-like protein/Flp pilus assembly protein TadD
MMLTSGTKLGPYEILSTIGAGGMGEVYRAKDTRLGRTVAIKVLNKEHMQRFEREARAIAALNHPHICTLHDIGPDYLVMEYVDGTAIKGPLPVEDAVKLAIQIAGALDEAHKRGILHRDLKPGNIMVTSGGSAKLLDFGLAKLSSGTESETASTMDGTVMGTPAYMSPEQAQGMPVDARSDIFSFGAVLYEIISGTRAFAGTSTVQVLSAVLRDEPKPLQTMPQLERIVARCLAKQPAQRFQTVAEVKAALEQVSTKPSEQQPSIAVLPFINMSGDKEQEYFSDGLAEEIINALVQIPGLKVTARTSAFAFKGKQEDIRTIAEALGVANILEGSVRRSGNRIRVTAQLIAAADGNHVWSERYDREMTDVFQIQDEISQAIADKLRVPLSERRSLAVRPGENVEAYHLCLKGRYHLFKMNPESIAKSKEYYEQALALDANYAPAWSGLADCYSGLIGFGMMPPKPAREQSLRAVLKALELDEKLPEAHITLGMLRASMCDWKSAESECRRALELAPENASALSIYSWFPMQNPDEALAMVKKALELDPLSPLHQVQVGMRYSRLGRVDLAIKHLQNALELDPYYYIAHVNLYVNYLLTGEVEEAIRVGEKAVQLVGRNPASLGMVAIVYARAHRIDEIQKLLGEMRERAKTAYVPAYCFALIYLALGQIDKGFDWLEKAIDEAEDIGILVWGSRILDPFSSHPRYRALLRKMNLEP